MFGIPVLVSVRSEREYRLATSTRSRLIGTFVFRNADRIGVQSETIRQAMLHELAVLGEDFVRDVDAKLCVLPNGVDIPAVKRIEAAGEYVLWRHDALASSAMLHLRNRSSSRCVRAL